jgi:hypothetical protein
MNLNYQDFQNKVMELKKGLLEKRINRAIMQRKLMFNQKINHI